MGAKQSTPPGLNEEQSLVARESYKKKCASALYIADEEIADRISDVPNNPMALLIRYVELKR
jgi:hypothetical protein